MALASTSIFEVRNGGSDTLNGGSFYSGATLAADGAATSATTNAPVFTSASYNFVAGDVGHWLFIKSGTNWLPGWYQIASVAANAATLSAAIGAAYLYVSTAAGPSGLNTAVGCATTGSPTSASWTIDYSQVDAVPFSLTGLTTAAANAIILTASATKAMIGNGIVITGGTNFTTGYYQVTAATAGVSLTVDRNCSTAAGAAGTAGLGGGLASPGLAGSIATTGGQVTFIKYNASPYVATSASTNIAAGCVSGTQDTWYCGYNTSRFLYNTDANRPTFQINTGVSSATLFGPAGNSYGLQSIILDGNSQTTSKCYSSSGECFYIKAMNGVSAGIQYTFTANGSVIFCEITGCSGVACNGPCFWCVSHGNTTGANTGGFVGPYCFGCIAYGNSRSGFAPNIQGAALSHCVSYGNTEHGFYSGNNTWISLTNCIAEENTLYGLRAGTGSLFLLNCASYHNTSGRSAGTIIADIGAILGAGTFFVDAVNHDFDINASAGAVLKAAGFPTAFPAGATLTTNYRDIGAAQHQDSGGGASTPYVIGS